MSAPTTSNAVDVYDARAGAAAAEVTALEGALKDARELRYRLIVEGVEQGLSWRHVAQANHVSQAVVQNALARPQRQ